MQSKDVVPGSSPIGCLVRLFWMAIGGLVCVLSLVTIGRRPGLAFGSADVLCLLAVIAMIFFRYVDIRRYGGTTATGEPATMAHWRRYSLRVVVTVAGAWCLAHGFAWLAGQ